MSLISIVQTYIKTYSEIKEKIPVWVNYMNKEPIEFSVVPLPGARIIEAYISGSSLREYTFALQSVESTADELARLTSLGFYEAFATWLETQTEAGHLPDMDEGQTPVLIEALGWGYLFEQGDSQTGIYQIQCRLEYDQVA